MVNEPSWLNPTTDSSIEGDYQIKWNPPRSANNVRHFVDFSNITSTSAISIPYDSYLTTGNNPYDSGHSSSLFIKSATNVTTTKDITLYIPSGATNIRLSFVYGVSSEAGWDKFSILLDDSLIINELSGNSNPQALDSYVITWLTPGTHRLTLRYTKDGSADQGLDAGIINDIDLSYDSTTTRVRQFVDFYNTLSSSAFSIPYGTYLTTGKNLYDSTHSGTLFLKGYTSGTTSTSITITVPPNATNARLTFLYGSSSEAGYDKFSLQLDNSYIYYELSGWSENQTFYRYETALTPGTHYLSLLYTKDQSFESGMDAGIINDLELTYDLPGSGNDHFVDFYNNTSTSAINIPLDNTFYVANNPYDTTHSRSLIMKGYTSQTFYRYIYLTIPPGATASRLTFQYGVSSEANCDFFSISINGRLITTISGFTNPQSLNSYGDSTLGPGTHVLELKYQKDGSVDTGLDAGIINDLRLTYETETLNISNLQYEIDISGNRSSNSEALTWTPVVTTGRGQTSYTINTRNYGNNSNAYKHFRIRSIGSTYSSWVTSPGFYISNIKSPLITTPVAGEVWTGSKQINWRYADEGGYFQSDKRIQLSTDNGTTWKDIYSGTSINSFTYDFSNEPETKTAKIRIQSYNTSGADVWNVSPNFTIFHKVVRGKQKVKTTSGITNIPIYDRWYGMGVKNGFRIQLANNVIGCFQLVDTTHALASPIRINTSEGIKSIAKEW